MATIHTRFGNLGHVCDCTLLQLDVAGSIGEWFTQGGSAGVKRDLSVLVTESPDQTCDDFAKKVDVVVLVSRVPQTVEERVVVTKPEYAGKTIVNALARLCPVSAPAHARP